MASKGFTIVRDDKITQYFHDIGTEGPIADFVNGSYIMRFRPGRAQRACAAVTNGKAKLWHQRMGHINQKFLENTARKNAIEGLELDELRGSFDCDSCHLGKEKRKPFPGSTSKQHFKPGERILADLTGKMSTRSVTGNWYALVMKDEATGFRMSYFLSAKSQAPAKIKDFIAFMETHTNVKVKQFMSDNGGEFCNSSFKKFLQDRGIVHETSAAYCPETNGKIEREMRTLVETARTLLHDAKLPVSLWEEVWSTATYLHNRCLNSTNTTITPYEAILGVTPSATHLRVYGCTAFSHVPDARRRKWDPKAIKCVLVGYAPLNRKYRLYNPSTKKIFESRNVSFRESEVGLLAEHPTEPAPKIITLDLSTPETRRIIEAPEWLSPNVDIGLAQEDDAEAEDNDPVPYEQSFQDASDDHALDHFQSAEEYRENTVAHPTASIPSPAQASTSRDLAPVPVAIPVELNTSKGKVKAISNITGSNPVSVTKQKTKDRTWFQPEVLEHRTRGQAKSASEHPGTANMVKLSPDSPTYKEAMESPASLQWSAAIEEEIASQEANKTWEIVNRPPGARVLATKWVLKVKQNPDGSRGRHKARLVMCGNRQEEGIDYKETFASVSRYESIRLLLAIAAAEGLQMAQFDVKIAFLYGDLEESIYARPPAALNLPEGKVLLLKKSIYGLKQSPRCWQEKMKQFLHGIGILPTQSEPSVFIGRIKNATLLVALYVDDGLLLCKSQSVIEDTLAKISKQFEITHGEAKKYIGLEINKNHSTGSITITQTHYIREVLERFKMEDCNPSNVPLQPYTPLEVPEFPSNEFPYRQLIGALLFIAKSTRPDIQFAVSKLSTFVAAYDESHWKAAKGVLRYLKGTMNEGLRYEHHPSKKVTLSGYTDSDYAGDPITRKSTTGYVFMINGAPVTWTSQKQPVIAQSSTEAEYIALSLGGREAIWLRKFLDELGYPQQPTPILIDNQSAIKLAKNPEMHSRTKHIDVRYHFIRDHVEKEDITLEYVHTSQQAADGLTKALLKGKLEENKKLLGVGPPPQQSNSTRGGPHQKRHHTLMFTLLLSCMFAAAAASDSIVPPVVWTQTNARAVKHFQETRMVLLLEDPCELIGEKFHQDLKQDALTECRVLYHKVLDALENWCPPHHISKREPFTITMFVIAAIAIGIGSVGTGLAIHNSNKISNLQTQVDYNAGVTQAIEQQIKELHSKVQNLTRSFDAAMERMEKHQRDYDEMKGKITDMLFATSSLVYELKNAISIIRHAKRDWKNNLVNPDIFKFLNVSVPCKEDCPLHLARPVRCRLDITAHPAIEIAVLSPMLNQDLIISRAHPFNLMVQRDTQICTGIYDGPMRSVLSRKNKCVVATIPAGPDNEVPLLPFGATCLNEPMSSVKVRIKVIETDCSNSTNPNTFVQVKILNNQAYVYCPGSNYSVSGKTRNCPKDVFKLPINMEVKINGIGVVLPETNLTARIQFDTALDFAVHHYIPVHMNWTDLEMKVPEDLKEIHPMFSRESAFWTMIGIGTSILLSIAVLGLCIWRCYKKGKNEPIKLEMTAETMNQLSSYLPQNRPPAHLPAIMSAEEV